MKRTFLLEIVAVSALLLVSVPMFSMTSDYDFGNINDWTESEDSQNGNEPMLVEEEIEPMLFEDDFLPEDDAMILDGEKEEENNNDSLEQIGGGFNGSDDDFNE